MNRPLALSFALVVIAGPGLAATAMTGKELTELLADGKELTLGGPKDGYSGHLSVMKDGTADGSIKLESGDVIPIQGVWHINGNKFCRTWKGGRDAGKEVCETWNKTGPTSVHVTSGKRDLGNNAW
ncbi:hypothetical protein [Rhizobium sp. R693]|uniref:hypothetical protein n=1 Tax=Rhizobium sp. R693 TaxID=1764276 RepID=UPI000B530992|nr:hypothetical protein [Rhizobium sp. R693]OWV90388.1 hypothetical protein ATY79_28515 [Rhizobium sp. R693]